MEFIGLEPFDIPMDVEVRHGGEVYDLHNTGWLRELTYLPVDRVLVLRWTIELPAEAEERRVVAIVTLRFEEVRELEAEIAAGETEAAQSALVLDTFFRMPDQNGPNWIQLEFISGARLAFHARTCSAEVQQVA